MNAKKLGNCGPTSCPKIGIKIHESGNEYSNNPFVSQPNTNQINQIKTTHQSAKTNDLCNTNNFDLNIENYSLKDIFRLFSIQSEILDEETMKQAKKFVLKTHPDKSKLDPTYFLFYSSAYKKLYGVYEFQNKSTKKRIDQQTILMMEIIKY